MRQSIRFIPLLAAALMLAGCAGMARERIYRPVPIAADQPAWRGAAPRPVTARTADGLVLNGHYWPPAGGSRDILVFFHGNGGNRQTAALVAEPLARHGSGVLVASYRGYGDNPGRPSEAGLFADGAAFVALARQLQPDNRLYLFGWSLGGAVALELAGRTPVDGVATLGAFSRLADAAPAAARPFLPDRFDNLAAIGRVAAPVYLFHGTRDAIVPFAHAERLRAASGDRATIVTIRGGGHHPISPRSLPRSGRPSRGGGRIGERRRLHGDPEPERATLCSRRLTWRRRDPHPRRMRWGIILALLALGACIPRGEERRAPPRGQRPAADRGSPDTLQCHVDLARERIGFRALPDQRFAGGCSALGAVQLLEIGTPVTNLRAMTCPLARQFARWAREAVQPAADQWLGSPVQRIETFGTYSCRSVNSQPGARLSEHGLANAVDVSGFVLADGRRVTVQQGWDGEDERVRRFLRAVHQAGCRRFNIGLGPDSDAYHYNHLHFDMGRGPYCR